MSNRRNLPEFLKAIPRWHPGAWGPPAETVSGASVVVAVLAAASLFRNELVRALFKFQFNPGWVAALATAIAGTVVWFGSKRPGSKWPRIWALVVVLFNFGMMIWAIGSRIFPGGDPENPAFANPSLHALTAVGFMAGLTLVARLFHIHPYSPWVWRAAPISLMVVVLFCLPVAFWAETVVEHHERRQLETKKDALSKIERCMHEMSSLSRNCEEQLDLSTYRQALPTRRDWGTLALLDRNDRGNRLPSMGDALKNTFQEVVKGLTNPQIPVMAEPQSYAVNASRTNVNWQENLDFQRKAENAAGYYRRIGQLHRDFEAALQAGSQEQEGAATSSGSSMPSQPGSQTPWDAALQNQANLHVLWIPALIKGASTSLPTLMESMVGNSGQHLGNLEYWKGLPLGRAESILEGKAGCSTGGPPLARTFRVGKQTPPPPPPPPASTVQPTRPGGGSSSPASQQTPQEPPIDYYWIYKKRIECYGYRPDPDSRGLAMLAELHLVYTYRRPVRNGYELGRENVEAPDVYLYFDVPGGSSNDDYQHEVMNALQGEAAKGSRRPLMFFPGQARVDPGFLLGTHRVTCRRTTRGSKTTIVAEYLGSLP